MDGQTFIQEMEILHNNANEWVSTHRDTLEKLGKLADANYWQGKIIGVWTIDGMLAYGLSDYSLQIALELVLTWYEELKKCDSGLL